MIRKMIVRQVVDLLDTVYSGISYLQEAQGKAASEVLTLCQASLKSISSILTDEELISKQICLEKIRTVADEISLGMSDNSCRAALQRVDIIRKRLQKEPVQLEIAFFPYKQSMWDCMDSVWRAADADPMCDCYVVPIPYYDRNADGSFGEFHYEGTKFPKDIPVVDYESYDVVVRKPDIIYIHNPYDEFNRVTSVDPHYYSHELKKHTDILVYIPYYVTVGAKKMGVEPTLTNLSAYRNADCIAVQSEQVKLGMLELGIPSSHILALGSPKMDSIVNHTARTCPSDWSEKLQGRTVFLVNTSLTDLLSRNQNWVSDLQKNLTDIAKHTDCAVIWRPHPLIEATLKSMRPEWLLPYRRMKQEFLSLNNVVFDQNSSYLPAFDASHAFVSDVSSLFLMYGITGKPVLLLTGSKSEKEHKQYPFADYYDYYFLQDGFTLDVFVDMVKKGQDINHDRRLAALHASFANLDGSAGEKIHKAVLDMLHTKG